jgi:uncharacterized protein (DUF885 family)
MLRLQTLAACATLIALHPLQTGCRQKARISDLTEAFTYTALSFSPSSATAAGLHEYNGQKLDGQLDDMGPAAMYRQTRFYSDLNQRLQQLDPNKLDPQERADLAALKNRVGLALLDLVEVRGYLHDPLRYVEILGNALYTPYTLDYAPIAERFGHIASRLRQVPLFLDQATTNISSAPAVSVKAAIEVDKGVLNMVDRELRAAVPAETRKDYDDAAAIALPALRKFQDYLQSQLQYLDNADWRLGANLYPRKFHFALESGGTPPDMLASAERELDSVQARMFTRALPLHRALAPSHKDHDELPERQRRQAILSEVLADISRRHSTPESFMDDVHKLLEESRAFAQRQHLPAPSEGANLRVMPMPEFLQNLDIGSRFHAAPPLEPQLTAFYWITPIPPDLPKEKAEARLRDYNSYRLKLLIPAMTIPGRFAQTEAANTVQPQWRRLLRTVFGDEAYWEGWPVFSMRVMMDHGFLDSSPEMALAIDKEQLRIIADAILDVRLHMIHMTDAEALDLLETSAFQSPEEAAAKLQRAKLTSCELPGYFIGDAKWMKASSDYRASQGGSLGDFYDLALKQGGVPMSSLLSLLIR